MAPRSLPQKDATARAVPDLPAISEPEIISDGTEYLPLTKPQRAVAGFFPWEGTFRPPQQKPLSHPPRFLDAPRFVYPHSFVYPPRLCRVKNGVEANRFGLPEVLSNDQ